MTGVRACPRSSHPRRRLRPVSIETPGAAPSGPRPVRAPRGTALSTRGWQQEAVLRMLMNNLDPEVAENPDELVVYGGTGRAARSWPAFDAIVRELRALADDETLLVQSGKPVAVFRTHEWAPRVLIANSNLVGKWANWDVVPGTRAEGPDDVRPDDRGVLDLHRDAGDPAGNVRDVRGARPPALRRDPARTRGPHGRPGRDGRRPAAVRDDERGRLHRDRGGRDTGAPPPRDRLRGPVHALAAGGAGDGTPGGGRRRCRSRSRSSATPRRSSPRGRRPASSSTW